MFSKNTSWRSLCITHSVGGSQAVDGGKDGTVDLTLEVPTRLVGDLKKANNRLGILL